VGGSPRAWRSPSTTRGGRPGSSASARDAYERLKRELASRTWDDVNHYAAAKGPLIEAIIARAVPS
jgi:hypothetical protein